MRGIASILSAASASEAAWAASDASTLLTTAVWRSARSAVRPPAAGAMKPDDSDTAVRFRRRDRGLLQIGDDAHQRQRFRRKRIAARRDRPAIGDDLAHFVEVLAP